MYLYRLLEQHRQFPANTLVLGIDRDHKAVLVDMSQPPRNFTITGAGALKIYSLLATQIQNPEKYFPTNIPRPDVKLIYDKSAEEAVNFIKQPDYLNSASTWFFFCQSVPSNIHPLLTVIDATATKFSISKNGQITENGISLLNLP